MDIACVFPPGSRTGYDANKVHVNGSLAMLDDPPLLTVKRPSRRPTQAQINAFKGAMTGNVVDCMGGRGAMAHSIKPHDPSIAVTCGPALTCFAYPADNLGLLGAMHLAQAGDVIVCANDAYTTTALVGDLVVGMLKNRGVSALVTDGMIRDQIGIEPWKLPLFHQGITPNSPAKNGPGAVGLPITIGGVTVETGDMIVCDRDGVVVVPYDRIDEVAATLVKLVAAEGEVEAQVKAGMSEPGYVAEMMASSQTRYVD
jgi:4-hydroxy-4-methyl-2-oxoglutarate aldolase